MSTPSHKEHKQHTPRSVGCMVITCSDTRTPETDTSGQLIQKLLKENGHTIAAYHLVKDEPAQIRARITEGVANDSVQAIIINGGTGISRRDSTFEAVDAMLEKRLDGFGEVFRFLTYQGLLKAASSSPPQAPKTPCAWRWKNLSSPNSVTSSKNSPSSSSSAFNNQSSALRFARN
jgi:molybdenum cofactor biosynthesis protein B